MRGSRELWDPSASKPFLSTVIRNHGVDGPGQCCNNVVNVRQSCFADLSAEPMIDTLKDDGEMFTTLRTCECSCRNAG